MTFYFKKQAFSRTDAVFFGRQTVTFLKKMKDVFYLSLVQFFYDLLTKTQKYIKPPPKLHDTVRVFSVLATTPFSSVGGWEVCCGVPEQFCQRQKRKIELGRPTCPRIFQTNFHHTISHREKKQTRSILYTTPLSISISPGCDHPGVRVTTLTTLNTDYIISQKVVFQ